MAKCKSCEIKFKKPKTEFQYPKNIPISKEMRNAVETIRKYSNGNNATKR